MIELPLMFSVTFKDIKSMESISFKTIYVLFFATFLLVSCGKDSGTFGPKTRVGDAAPESKNMTVDNVDDWYKVSSMDTKVDLYKWQISDLLKQHKPFLVVFGTPQHCTMCVDQIARIAVMQEKYGENFAFVHVDGYRDTSIWVEWGVTGEPWTFLVDEKGKVRKIFPGQTEITLLEHEVKQMLKDAS